jgi:hypothetical protein
LFAGKVQGKKTIGEVAACELDVLEMFDVSSQLQFETALHLVSGSDVG